VTTQYVYIEVVHLFLGEILMTTVKVKGKGNYRKEEVLLVPPEDINIIDGFNASNRTDDISDIIDSIQENGVLEPLQGYIENNALFLTSGHRRLESVKQLIKLGVDIREVPFITKPKLTPDQQMFDVLIHNGGKPLTELQEGEMFEKAIKHGYKQEEIAKKIGKTQAHVSQRLTLMKSITKYLKNYLINEMMTAHAALHLSKIHPVEEDQKKVVEKILINKSKLKGDVTLEQAIEELKKAGRCKISAPEIPRKPGRQKANTSVRTTKNQKIFSEAVEYMTINKYHPSKIKKIETIGKALENSKNPHSLVKAITSVL